jgi:hypothetical protein
MSFLDADVYLYLAEEGGRHTPVIDGFRCPCFTEKDAKIGGWDCIIRIEGQPLKPGHHRRALFTFLSGGPAEKFYLWGVASLAESVDRR